MDNDGFLSTVGATQSYGTANALNGYSSVNGNAYGYDGRGNVTTAGALIAMSYDSRNMLTRYAQGGTVQSMGYYPEGGRAWKQLNGVTTLTFEALGVEWGDYDVNGNLVRRYVRSTATGGPGGGDVMGWVDSSGARSLAVHDRQGSVVTVLNASGQSISAYYAYNDFGQSAQDGQTGSPYRYAGMRYDEIGLYVTPNRTYVPGIGRWLQMDPSGIKDGLNRYAYVGNDPLSQYDPLGLQAMGVWVPEGPLPVYLPPELAPGSPQGIQAGNVLAGNITQGLANLGNFAQSVPDRIIAGGIAGALMLNKAFSDKEGEGPQVNPNKQGKHQPGHRNFQPGKSELTHPDPQELVDKGAGTGQQVGSTPVGDAGSKERVDFGENIGTHVDPVTGDRNPTDIGIIHYGKDDVHIVPARPNPY
ncbi:MAG: polymorphic toxin type 50 domain-containing protein [Azospirillaceae bacterium]|nr:polymorphic toxin type 50 domain-containing protein [Azospirillaceae bacterium]